MGVGCSEHAVIGLSQASAVPLYPGEPLMALQAGVFVGATAWLGCCSCHCLMWHGAVGTHRAELSPVLCRDPVHFAEAW